MASYAKDPRCIAMAEALAPLLRRSCPEGAGGFGGSYQVNLDDEEAVGLGGVELIRAAMRRAARQLDWKVETIGWIGTRFGTMIAVSGHSGGSRRASGRGRRRDVRAHECRGGQGFGRAGRGSRSARLDGPDDAGVPRCCR
ncbi:hypothetical protein [Streptomyces sp. AC550_RSS872]|uniref:hypothetical protein n=1 Tax=Streptomyces sp. AC550_RSS872 TaxID=2823689 RepID=UPI0020B6D59D|nr:hypothetical protein [Streptomyces sp. AC550_RSS872]